MFVPTDQVSHSTPSLLTGRLLTSVQVNNMASLHNTYTDTHIVPDRRRRIVPEDSPTERIITLRITSERITSEHINTERITS